jgi:FlaG/FlaF family flagellin (archaellin)
MDFTNRNAHPHNGTAAPQQPQQAGTGAPQPSGGKDKDHKPKEGRVNKWLRISPVILLYCVTVLIVATLFVITFGQRDHESSYISGDEYQAVFINVNGTQGGQVYFGKIQSLTPSYIHLTNVFYIQNQATKKNGKTQQAYNLVKLGCELHAPEDAMNINRHQVFFWENLKSSGQVSQKISQYYKKHPNGQKCNSNQNKRAPSQQGNKSTGKATQQKSTNNQSTQVPPEGNSNPPKNTSQANNNANKDNSNKKQ